MSPSIATRNRVRDLNDAFRTGGFAAGDWVLTRGVASAGPEFVAMATAAVQGFEGFTPGNDPYGEHDFGALNLVGKNLLWKIDYYDRKLEFGSADPGNPSITRRVLTIMLAEEY